MRSVNELVSIATGAVPAHVVNQDEEYVWPVGSLCSFLGPDPGGMNPGQPDNKQQWKKWLHPATSGGTRGEAAIPLEKSSKDLFDSPGAVMILLDGNPGAVEHADEEIGKGHAAGKLTIMAVLVAKVFAARNNRWIMLAPVQRTGGAAVEDYGVVQQGSVLIPALVHLVEKGAEPGQ